MERAEHGATNYLVLTVDSLGSRMGGGGEYRDTPIYALK